jgi:hypothetical protein
MYEVNAALTVLGLNLGSAVSYAKLCLYGFPHFLQVDAVKVP